ncbi:MATE family efflux transporter [Facklamia hominis]|uniref:Probable multidrug resistance protein NorM n=1 Tax=Facklamia hominis CCUG 36813 TaxID=883111 RepID=K1LP18_9LACT|nr:MATE family efflux transporter [Facklamia hominis]EKB53872.1 MATE efflux family protein [Facklamia hominis CCUG 36813]
MIKNKSSYKTALKMAWPSVLESFFIALAAIIDTIMVGNLGEYAIAAVGLTNQPRLIGLSLFFAINIAVSSLIARRRGQNQQDGANEVFVTAMTLSLILCAIISGLMIYFSQDILRLAGAQSDTLQPATQYFRIIMGGMIFNVIAMCINAAQRGSGNTRIAFNTNLTSSIVNICFNYLLIDGHFGFPALGIQGAALATVLGTIVAMLMSFRSLFYGHSYIRFKRILQKKIRLQWDTAKIISQLSANLFVENLAMRIGFLATAVTAAGLGTQVFAVHNAGMNILSLGFSFADGMQVAAVALAGRSLGQNDRKAAINYGQVCQRIGFIMSISLAVILFLFGTQIMSIYFTDPSSIQMGKMIMDFSSVIVLLQISQLIYAGCLRAGGDVRYTLFAGILSVAIIRTAVTLIAVHTFHLGLAGIWIGIFSDQLTRFILMHHRFKKGYWTTIRI